MMRPFNMYTLIIKKQIKHKNKMSRKSERKKVNRI